AGLPALQAASSSRGRRLPRRMTALFMTGPAMPCDGGDGKRNARQTKGERRGRRHIGPGKTGVGRMRALLAAGTLSLAVAVPQPALAQFSDSYKFLEAIRKSDADAVIKAVEQPGVTLINTKDRSTGETALHITIGRRDLRWTTY